MNWNGMTISYNDVMIFAQFKIRREITWRGCHVWGGSGIHIPRGVWLSEIEGVESAFNISWTSVVDMKCSLWRTWPKNSILLGLSSIIGPVPIGWWIWARWNKPRGPILPLRWTTTIYTREWISTVSSTSLIVPTAAILSLSTVSAIARRGWWICVARLLLWDDGLCQWCFGH
jgi:hypothetical protein